MKTNLEWHKGETEEESERRHRQWSKMHEETKMALLKSFPDINEKTGQAIWCTVKNMDVYLPPQWTTDPNFDTGRSFRSWGALLSEIVLGTCYLDYYCNLINVTMPEFVEEVKKKMLSDGWVFEDA